MFVPSILIVAVPGPYLTIFTITEDPSWDKSNAFCNEKARIFAIEDSDATRLMLFAPAVLFMIKVETTACCHWIGMTN